MPGESRGAPSGVSRDAKPVENVAVTTTFVTVGPVMEIETVGKLTVTLSNRGTVNAVNGKLEVNDFTGSESDGRWLVFNDTEFAGLAASSTKRSTFDITAKYVRFRVAAAVGTSAVDLAYTGV